MSSANRSPLSEFDAASRDLVAPVRRRLAGFCAEPALHARFLNTLSLLEHIGSRKIMATQTRSDPDHDTLKHLAEETRHAFFFKRAAQKLAQGEGAATALGYASGETLAGGAARFYIGRLDATLARVLVRDAAVLPYLYMSLIVELRAVWLYRIYDGVLSEAHPWLSLKSVLAEEEHHLDAMAADLARADPKAPFRIATFSAWEGSRFRKLWRAIEDGAARPRLAAE
jgi:hypothetical protein